MSRYKKGESGNPNGRPKGSKNKSQKEIRDFISDLMHRSVALIYKDWLRLPPKDRIKYTIGILPYILPKLSPKDTNDDNYLDWSDVDMEKEFYLPEKDELKIDVSKLSPELLERVQEELGIDDSEDMDIYLDS